MNNLLVGIIIGVLLGVVAYSVLTESCPPVREVGSAWSRLSDAYHAGEISFAEYVRGADRLIECSEKRRRRYEQDQVRSSRDGD